MWVALTAFGLEHAGAWALAAGLFHIVPYFRPLLATAVIWLAGFIQFVSLSTTLAVVFASLATATIVGTFVTT